VQHWLSEPFSPVPRLLDPLRLIGQWWSPKRAAYRFTSEAETETETAMPVLIVLQLWWEVTITVIATLTVIMITTAKSK
jgi:hypothetical protein